MTRILFMGTPEAAVPTLVGLSSRFAVDVVTQPDRPVGRSKRLMPGPVKIAAEALGLSVLQPASAPELAETVINGGLHDLGVVVAYGRLLPPEVLAAPEGGILNVHFSLLPRWRGAAPVNRAIMAGDQMTGVTIIKIDEGLDTGPVLTAQAVDIEPEENAGELTERLAGLGASLLLRTVDPYLAGDMQPIAQSDDGLTYASKLARSERPISMTMAPQAAVDHIRGLAPKPAATLVIDSTLHKIYSARVSDSSVPSGHWQERDGWPVVGLDQGSLLISSLQEAGKNTVSGDDWVRGKRSSGGVIS